MNYDDAKTVLNSLPQVRDFLARVVSGKTPQGADFTIGSGAAGSVLPDASGHDAGEVLTLGADDDRDSAEWSPQAAQSGSTAIVTAHGDSTPDPAAHVSGTVWIQRLS